MQREHSRSNTVLVGILAMRSIIRHNIMCCAVDDKQILAVVVFRLSLASADQMQFTSASSYHLSSALCMYSAGSHQMRRFGANESERSSACRRRTGFEIRQVQQEDWAQYPAI